MRQAFADLLGQHHKTQTQDNPITRLSLPPRLRISLAEYDGQQAVPLVRPGNAVTAYQSIAQPGGRFGVYRHTPCHAIVESVDNAAIELRPTAWGDQAVSGSPPSTLSALCERLRQRGVCGLGGSRFPTHMKLARGAYTLIINAVECEPYLNCDHRQMLEASDKIRDGLQLLLVLLQPERCILAGHQPYDELELPAGVEFLTIRGGYPSGSERQLEIGRAHV